MAAKRSETNRQVAKIVSNITVFISHRNVQPSNDEAKRLQKRLNDERGYDCFFDKESLKGGDNWKAKIHSSIRDSDVLILMIQKDSESDWVRREVDIARGANVNILPIVLAEPNEDIAPVQAKLDLGDIQYMQYTDSVADDNPQIFNDLVERIEILSKLTRDNQKTWLKNLEQRRKVKKADDKEVHRTYPVNGTDFKIHISTGDITKLKGIEVLVNSENDYMQMARIYERATLSSALRREGSYITKGRIREDTVQDELDEQIKYSDDYCGRPIVMGQVIPTTAGHPDSTLRLNGARYIFHAAIVRVDAITRNENLVPIETDDGLRRAVHNCLSLISEVDSQNGIILPEKSSNYERHKQEAEGYQKIKSIIFPIFGAGHAGRSAFDVIRPMGMAFKSFALANKDNKELKLSDIYLCVFSETELAFAEKTFEEIFNDESEV